MLFSLQFHEASGWFQSLSNRVQAYGFVSNSL